MNFTLEIKKELIFNKLNKKQLTAFISGILFSNAAKDLSSIKIKLLNKEIYSEISQLFSKSNYEFETSKNIIYVKNPKIEEINAENANLFFAGIFLSSGSISNLNSSSYHLEISFKDENNCNQIQEFAKKHIIFNKIKNKSYYVLYLKKNESISDFLQIIGAQKSYFNFIDSIIERDFKNQITRIFNLDVHNQNRLVDSNILFKENYQYIKENNLLNKFKNIQLEFFEFKFKNEFLSLSQLSEKFSKLKKQKITKSGLNHWLIKLRNVCEEDINMKNKSTKN